MYVQKQMYAETSIDGWVLAQLATLTWKWLSVDGKGHRALIFIVQGLGLGGLRDSIDRGLIWHAWRNILHLDEARSTFIHLHTGKKKTSPNRQSSFNLGLTCAQRHHFDWPWNERKVVSLTGRIMGGAFYSWGGFRSLRTEDNTTADKTPGEKAVSFCFSQNRT